MNRSEILNRLSLFKTKEGDKYGIESLRLFGSVARDEADEESDVDLCITMRTPDLFAMVHIREDLQKLLGRRVDLVRYRNRMNPYLKKRIDREALEV